MATGDFVLRNIRALKWDGTNGALIAQMCGEIEVDDSTWSVDYQRAGEKLVLRQYQSERNNGLWTVTPAKPWVLISNDFAGIWANLTDAAFVNRYIKWVDLLQQAVDSSVINIPTYSLVTTSGELALPVLTAVSPNFTAVVPLRNQMPSDSYNVTWRALAGVQLLSSITLQAGKSITRTRTSVTLPLRTTGATTVAGIVTVEASALVAV